MKINFSLESRLDSYNGVAIVPIKNDEPILIFKHFGENFHESSFEGDACVPLFDCSLYWKGDKLSISEKIKKQYGETFYNQIMNEAQKPYLIEALPEGVLELPLAVFKSQEKLSLLRKEYLTPVVKILRQIGALQETRGMIKSRNDIQRIRDGFIIQKFKSLKKKKPFPIKMIAEELELYFLKKYPGYYNEGVVSHSTIRRILKSFIKK